MSSCNQETITDKSFSYLQGIKFLHAFGCNFSKEIMIKLLDNNIKVIF